MTEYKIPLKDGKIDWSLLVDDAYICGNIDIQEDILQALYNHALEEAAKKADIYSDWHIKNDDGLSGFSGMATGAYETAGLIRNLKEPTE